MGDRRETVGGQPRERRLWILVPILFVIATNLVVMSASGALPIGPLNDLLALGQLGGDTPDKAPIQQNAEPPLAATPLVNCGPGSREEPGVDGRVPADS